MGKLLTILLILAISASAQEQYTQCQYHYFGNKHISTSQCYDKDGRWGKARAYNKAGKQIYEAELRRVAGHASIEFDYYPEGAVSKAKWHSAPDAGIQWYNTTTYFDRSGNIPNVEHNDYDHSPGTTVQLPRLPATVTPQKQATIACAAIYATEYWFINRCKYPVVVTVVKTGAYATQKNITVAAGDTIKGVEVINAEQFVDIPQQFAFSVRSARRKRAAPVTRWLPFTQPAASVRRYYLVAEAY